MVEGEGWLEATVVLPATDWTPACWQKLWFRGVEGAQGPCCASFVFTCDQAFSGHYASVVAQVLASIELIAPVSGAALAAQEAVRWSVFDGMDPEERARVRERWMRQLPPAPHSEPQPEPVLVQTAVFHEPLVLEVEDEGAARAALAALDAAARQQVSRLAWAHCRECFDDTDYGAPDGVDNTDFLGVHDAEEALAALGRGVVREHDGGLTLQFHPVWENEHGFCLLLTGGILTAHSW